MKKTPLALVAFAGLTACGEAASPPDVSTARVHAAPLGAALAAAHRDPAAGVAAFLGDGLEPRDLELTHASAPLSAKPTTGPRGALRHLRYEQRWQGLRVHGAYAKAAIDAEGRLVHLVEQLVPAADPVPATISPDAALTAALVHLGLAASGEVSPIAEIDGTLARFAPRPGLYRAPTAERVAYADESGGLREGYLVETWTLEDNLLDHTLVDGAGAVVSVERRTNTDRYNVFVEDPLKGAQTVVSGPAPGGILSPNGWLGTGAQTTVNISGNNAHAYLDADANNAPDSGGAAVTNGDFLTAVSLTQAPSTASNRAVAVQNLFYLNNVVHDALYQHGFVESEGNFQSNNFGLGGASNDPVNAEAQDGSGTDNANFSTPADGSSPRMQMYLWTGAAPDSFVRVSGIDYGAYRAAFGPALSTTPLAGSLALYADGTAPASDGCEAATVSLTGRIALIDRGTCDFTVKVRNAQNAGAVAVVIMNNTGTNEAFGPGGSDRRVRIPSVMVGFNDGQALRARAGSAADLRPNPTPALQIDGDLDADIVFHEYGHGLTWRMIGGMSGALAGAIGEGASDVVAFLLDGDDRIGEYSYSNPAGIRRQPYADYVGTYANANVGEVHDDGEIYAATMYDVLQAYTAAGLPVSTVLDDFVGGMRFTPATPAFENMRDGMLQQAAGTGRECLIWRAFAGRGIGVGARGSVSRRGAVTITESFTVPATCP